MTERKNVVVIINTLSKGGAEKQSVILANQLSSYHNTTLLILDDREPNIDFVNMIDPNVDKLFLSGFTLGNLFSLIQHHKVKSADVVISMLARSNLTASLIGILNKDVKVLGGIRNCRLKKGKYTLEFVMHKYFHDRTIFNNRSGMENLIAGGFRNEKSICIHNAVESVPEIRNHKQYGRGDTKIISLSRFEPQKDLNTAVFAIEHLVHDLECKKGFIYCMSGYGSEKQLLEKLINEKNLSEYIKIIDNPEVQSLLNDGDIFINTSIIEGTSNSILEAMSYSLPIIATDAGDNSYLVEDSHNGFITEVGDYQALARKLKELIENRDLRHEYGKNSYQRVKEKFNTERFTKQYLKLIDE